MKRMVCLVGTSIYDAVTEAQARAYEEPVSFDFNGIDVVVNPADTTRSALERYWRAQDVRGQRGPYILTASGVRFHPRDPRPEDIVLADVAVGLACVCRYGAQLGVYYSVAEHSVLVSQLVPPEHALEALLHDGHEAYPPGDVPTPVKMMVEATGIVELQAGVDVAVRAAFGLPDEPSPEVEDADRWAFVIESRTLRRNLPADYFTTGRRRDSYDKYLDLPMPHVPAALNPEAAKRLWLGRYEELGGPKL